MTVQKAVEMIQNLMNCELEAIKIFRGTEFFDKNMQLIAKGKADYLEQILHQIEPETYPCNHPKKWQDVCDGQLYCTGCNQNL